jgi:PPM family protein phosphatase
VKIGWTAIGCTDVGRVRESNEDAYHVDARRGVFLVADGMGGHAAGEVASSIATSTVGEAMAEAMDDGHRDHALLARLKHAFADAQVRIDRCCADDPRTQGMGTTLTALVLTPDGTYRMGHLGDSRAYRFRSGRLEQLTRDHTWVQREIDAGRLAPRAARSHKLAHVITRVLGADSRDEPDLLSGTVTPGDVLMLATDGLCGMLTDEEMTRVLANGLPLRHRAEALVATANEKGGTDNITVVLVETQAER